MSEEVETDTLQRIVDRCNDCKFATCEQCEINWCEVQAIKNLLEKNKELKKYETYYKEMEEVNKKFIPKSKIKEKIKEYNIPILDVLDKLPIPRNIEVGIGAKDGIIYILQELLEEGE